MAEWKTLGEALVERELEKEIRVGVEHYVEGQRRVVIEEEVDPNIRVATLSFVSALGVIVMPLVKVAGGEWEPALDVYRLVGLSYDYGLRQVPPCFALADDVLAELREAEEADRG